MSKIAKVLKDARALIDTPKKWCQKTYGISENSTSLSSWQLEKAVAFCLSGALIHASHMEDISIRYKAELIVKKNINEISDFTSIVDFNDAPERTHEEILKVLDATIGEM